MPGSKFWGCDVASMSILHEVLERCLSALLHKASFEHFVFAVLVSNDWNPFSNHLLSVIMGMFVVGNQWPIKYRGLRCARWTWKLRLSTNRLSYNTRRGCVCCAHFAWQIRLSAFVSRLSCRWYILHIIAPWTPGPPVTLDEFCVPDAAVHLNASALPTRFKLMLQPDQLHLETSVLNGTSNVHAKVQFVFSAPCDPDHLFWSCTSTRDSRQFKAVFGSIESMRVCTHCHGNQSDIRVDIRQMQMLFATFHPHQSVKAPWYYLPSDKGLRRWFEVASNASKDALRVFVADVSVPTHCDDIMFLSASASVLLREIATAGLGCGYEIVSADSQNVSFRDKTCICFTRRSSPQ